MSFYHFWVGPEVCLCGLVLESTYADVYSSKRMRAVDVHPEEAGAIGEGIQKKGAFPEEACKCQQVRMESDST